MVKVRFETVTLRIPVIDNSGDHDAKISEDDFELVDSALGLLERLSGVPPRREGYDPSFATGGAGRIHIGESMKSMARRMVDDIAKTSPPVSQEDPVINTTVTDREMSGAPDMSLEEFREPPERTRAAPRPRANSWRHNQ